MIPFASNGSAPERTTWIIVIPTRVGIACSLELKKAEIPLQKREWNAGKEEVQNRLKANIGRYLYSNNVVQKVIFSEDRELQKAVEITRNKIKKETKSKK